MKTQRTKKIRKQKKQSQDSVVRVSQKELDTSVVILHLAVESLISISRNLMDGMPRKNLIENVNLYLGVIERALRPVT